MNTTDTKTWLITGAGRGMGVEFARAALAAGHNVVATGRNPNAVRSAVGEHEDLLVTVLDVTDAQSAAQAVAASVERFGRIDVLVNNAGNFLAGFFEELSPEQVRGQIRDQPLPFDDVPRRSRRSTTVRDPHDDRRRAQTNAFWNSMNGKQAGDPAKLARALVEFANSAEPPLRWVAGEDVVEGVEQKARLLLAQVDAHRELSTSLAYDDAAVGA